LEKSGAASGSFGSIVIIHGIYYYLRPANFEIRHFSWKIHKLSSYLFGPINCRNNICHKSRAYQGVPSGVALHVLVTCNSPSVQLGLQRESAIAPVHTLRYVTLPYVPLAPGSQDYPTTFLKQTCDLCITTRCARSTASPCHESKVSHPNLVRCSGIYHGIDNIAQVEEVVFLLRFKCLKNERRNL
jgi:hypothetical protein